MSNEADFVHLRIHSAYSLLEGALKIKQLIALGEKDQASALAITDTANLFGALEFSLGAKEAGIQPLIGVQISLKEPSRQNGSDRTHRVNDQLVLLAQNETGYQNLMVLVSHSYLDESSGDSPEVSLDNLLHHNDGLLLLLGGVQGPIGRLLNERRINEANDLLKRLKQSFDGRVHMEIQRHGLALERKLEPLFIEMADRHEIPLVATNEVFFSDPSMYEAHDALLCIKDGTLVATDERFRLTDQHYFKTTQEMRTLFADLPDACDNTLVVAQRCSFMVQKRDPILPPYRQGDLDESSLLRRQSLEGLKLRLERSVYTPSMSEGERETIYQTYSSRIDYELGIIEKMGFPGYFLIVADFIQWSKQQDIPIGPGRGSGAGSVVAWALTITDLDPLRFGLLFERFLNPERISMPDFDIDFCQDRRIETIKYVQAKYGYNQVAQIITFGKLQARAALRDVGRVLSMPYSQVDRISKMIPNNPAKPVTLKEALAGDRDLRDMYDQDPAVAKLLNISMQLEGLYRHASTHAAGLVIGDRPLSQLVPLYRDPRSDMPVTQFNMKWVEAAGLVKFDFLGLKTLSIMAKCLAKIKTLHGVTINLSTIPFDDDKTYQMLSRSETVGVFQLESGGMRDVLRKMKPNRLEDLIAIVALYRPGPMEQIPLYIACKHNQAKPDYMHPSLEPILAETFGIMIYQEQVMQIAQILSGYSLGAADLLRRAMGKKDSAEMQRQQDIFVGGAVAKGVEAPAALSIFQKVAKFAEYGFNKSHAAAYALVAYQTAWLKANYPAEFIAASMAYDLGNIDKLNMFRQELERLGIALLPPDINRSQVDFSVEAPAGEIVKKPVIYYSLAALKNVGVAAIETLVAERNHGGAFKDMIDFIKRFDPHQMNKRQIETLINAGAFDRLEENRTLLFANIEAMISFANHYTAEKAGAQIGLFGEQGAMPFKFAPAQKWSSYERLAHEREAVGFYLSEHPLDAFSKSLARLKVIKSHEIAAHIKAGGKPYLKMAGVLQTRTNRVSSRGNRYAHLQFSDAGGVFEVTCFAETLGAADHLLVVGASLLCDVDVKIEDGEPRLTGHKLYSLESEAAKTSGGVKVFIQDQAPIPRLSSILNQAGKGKNKISVVLQLESGQVEIDLKKFVNMSRTFIDELRSIAGVHVEEI